MAGVMSSGRLRRLCLKELRETLRDRRTIITLVLMPLLVYPLLSMTMQRFLLTSSSKQQEVQYTIGVNDDRVAQSIIENTRLANMIREQAGSETMTVRRKSTPLESPLELPIQNPDNNLNRGAANSDTAPQSAEPLTSEIPEFRVLGIKDEWQTAMSEGTLDLFIELIADEPASDRQENWRPLKYRVHYVENDLRSEKALLYFQQLVQTVDHQYAEELTARRGQRVAWPLAFIAEPVTLPKGGVSALVTMIPLVLILMTITGAVYPAIDLTAGERERGTMEILIASPAPRWSLLFAKYVAVVSVALLTAVANLSSMFTTLYVTGLGKILLGEKALSVPVLLQVFCLLVLFSMFFSAVMLTLTSFAKSFKEAQAYLIPVMLLALAPGVLSLLPGIEFTPLLACVPLVNIVLLARDLLLGNANLALALAAIFSTMVYAAAAIGIAARLFGSDAVLHGSRGSWVELFTRPSEVSRFPRFDQMALFLAMLFPLYFILSNLVGQLRESSISVRLILNAVITAFLFGLLPWMYCRFEKIKLGSTFRWSWPPLSTAPLFVLFSLALATSLWMAAHELFLGSRWLGIETLRAEQVKAAQGLIEQFRSVSPWLVLFSFALIPALFEEFFFRGFVFSSLNQLSRPGAILVSAVLFGLFHVIVGSVLAIERFLPTALMGLFLGWLAYRSGSLWPGIFLHAAHNGLLLMTAYYADTLKSWGIGVEEQAHLPISWLIGGTVVTLVSLIGVELLARFRPATTAT